MRLIKLGVFRETPLLCMFVVSSGAALTNFMSGGRLDD